MFSSLDVQIQEAGAMERRGLTLLGIIFFIIMTFFACTAVDSYQENSKESVLNEDLSESTELKETKESITEIEDNTTEIKDNATEIIDNTTEILSEESGNEETEYIPVTMAFTGDIYLSDKLYGYYSQSGVSGFLSDELVRNFRNVDLMICDHEYAATNLPDSEKDTIQLYNFKSPTEYEVIWKDLGVDIVTLANNHTLDYGKQGLLDTFAALDEQNISYIGAGNNLEEAKSAEIRMINGKKIAVIAASRFIPSWDWYAKEDTPGIMTTYESTDRFDMMKEEITRLKEEEKCDIVVAFVHFGTEKSYAVNDNQPVIAHGYADAGADLVIGCHAHNLQGIEIYNGTPIYYNLGNFLFGNYATDTMIVNVKINEDNSLETSIVPCKSSQYKTVLAEGDEGTDIIEFVESISVNVEIDKDGNVKEKLQE